MNHPNVFYWLTQSWMQYRYFKLICSFTEKKFTHRMCGTINFLTGVHLSYLILFCRKNRIEYFVNKPRTNINTNLHFKIYISNSYITTDDNTMKIRETVSVAFHCDCINYETKFVRYLHFYVC